MTHVVTYVWLFLGNALTTMLLHKRKTRTSSFQVQLYEYSDHWVWCCAWFCRSSCDKLKAPLLGWATGHLRVSTVGMPVLWKLFLMSQKSNLSAPKKDWHMSGLAQDENTKYLPNITVKRDGIRVCISALECLNSTQLWRDVWTFHGFEH